MTAYCAADIVIVPSRQENLPQVATEAQSCGRAVAAFNTSGLKDAITDGETGLLIPAYDTKRGADLLDLIKDQPRLSTMETTARDRAARTWSPSVIAGNIMSISKGCSRCIVDHRHNIGSYYDHENVSPSVVVYRLHITVEGVRKRAELPSVF